MKAVVNFYDSVWDDDPSHTVEFSGKTYAEIEEKAGQYIDKLKDVNALHHMEIENIVCDCQCECGKIKSDN